MIRIFTLILSFFTLVLSANAQIKNRNIVLIEEFTNTGCGPCASYAPTLDSVVSYRLGEVILVKYHGSYPDKNDPYYLDQKDDINKRISLYKINAYPTTILNGDVIGNSMSGVVLNNYINMYLQEERNFDIALETSVADHTLNVSATVTVDEYVQDARNLRLFIVPIEEYYESPKAYANGETEMRYIMRRILPDGDGHALGVSMVSGIDYDYETSCSLSNFEDENQLGVVAFIQDMSTKKILATSYVPRKASVENGLVVMNVENTPDLICTPDFSGLVTFRNVGANTLHSAVLNVEINGTLKTYEWTGSLDYLEKATLQIEDFTDFVIEDRNAVSVYFTDINGTELKSNEFNLAFSSSIQAKGAVQMKLYTDRKPEETTWKLFNSSGDVVEEGGPYSDPRHFYTHNFNLKNDDCYTLEFYDAGGDGIEGSFGNGYFQIFQLDADGKTSRLTQGTYNGSVYDVAFNLKEAAPTLNIADVISGADVNSKVSVSDISGCVLLNTTVSELKSMDLTKFNSRILILRIYDGNKETVRKIFAY